MLSLWGQPSVATGAAAEAATADAPEAAVPLYVKRDNRATRRRAKLKQFKSTRRGAASVAPIIDGVVSMDEAAIVAAAAQAAAMADSIAFSLWRAEKNAGANAAAAAARALGHPRPGEVVALPSTMSFSDAECSTLHTAAHRLQPPPTIPAGRAADAVVAAATPRISEEEAEADHEMRLSRKILSSMPLRPKPPSPLSEPVAQLALVVMEDPVTVVQPLGRMRDAIVRLKVKKFGRRSAHAASKGQATDAHAVEEDLLDAAAAKALALALGHSNTGAERALLPHGASALLDGAEDKVRLTRARFVDTGLASSAPFLDEVQPRYLEVGTGAPVPLAPCRLRTGRYCTQDCAPCDPLGEGVNSDLAQFGGGVVSFFKWLKAVGFLLFFQTLVMAPLLWLYSSGTKYTLVPPLTTSTSLARYSLGALGDSGTPSLFSTGDISNVAALGLVLACYFMSCLVFLFATCCLRLGEAADAAEGTSGYLTVDQYSVEIDDLPARATVADVREFLQQQVLLRGEGIVRIAMGVDYSAYLRVSARRQALISRIEVLEARLACLYDGMGLVPPPLPPTASEATPEETRSSITSSRRSSGGDGGVVEKPPPHPSRFGGVPLPAKESTPEKEAREKRMFVMREVHEARDALGSAETDEDMAKAATRLKHAKTALASLGSRWVVDHSEEEETVAAAAAAAAGTAPGGKGADHYHHKGSVAPAVDASDTLGGGTVVLAQVAVAYPDGGGGYCDGSDEGRVHRLWSQRRALLQRGAELLKKLPALHQKNEPCLFCCQCCRQWCRPVCCPDSQKAWVTLHSQAAAIGVIARMRHRIIDGISCGSTIPRWKRFRGVFPLRVVAAPKPSSIVWEHLAFSRPSRMLLQCVTILSVFLLAIFTMAALFVVRSYLSAEANSVLSTAANGTTATHFPAKVIVRFNDSIYPSWLDLLTDSMLTGNATILNSVTQFLPSESVASSTTSVFSIIPAALLGVLILAQWLQTCFVRACVMHVEKHHTTDEQDVALFRAIFTTQVINATLLLMLVEANYGGLPGGGPLQSLWHQATSDSVGSFFAQGHFSDFSSEWYITVGTPLVLLQASNLILPHLGPLAQCCGLACVRCCTRAGCSRPASQLALNQSLLGPQLRLPERLGMYAATFAVCFILSLGLPLLLPIGAVVFGFAYWAELCAFARLYRTPPFLSTAVVHSATALLPFILIAQAGVATWFVSGPTFPKFSANIPLPSSLTFAPLIRILHLPPLVTLSMLVVALALIFSDITSAIAKAIMAGIHNLCSRIGTARAIAARYSNRLKALRKEKIERPLTVHEVEESAALDRLKANFRDALRTGFLSDVETYDIRDNPAYFFAFGVPKPKLMPREYVAPDPGLAERELALPPSEPNTDTLVMQHAGAINSYSTFKALCPVPSDRQELYGPSLFAHEAVILEPAPKPRFLEGRTGVLFKPLERVHVALIGDETSIEEEELSRLRQFELPK